MPAVRWRLATAIKVVAVLAICWLVFASWDYEFERTETLTPNLRLVENMRAERSAFTLGGHATPVMAIPIPSRNDRILQQTLMRGDEVLWQGLHDDIPPPFPVDADFAAISAMTNARRPLLMYASPNERFVAFRTEGDVLPVRVFDATTKRAIEVPAPDSTPKRSEYEYPLRFHGWSHDSRTLYLRTHEGRDSSADVNWYREIYRVDPLTGATLRVARCVGPGKYASGSPQPDWVGTACADSARP